MIIVTGASKGLGRAICDRLMEKNIEVFGLARGIDGLFFLFYRLVISIYIYML